LAHASLVLALGMGAGLGLATGSSWAQAADATATAATSNPTPPATLLAGYAQAMQVFERASQGNDAAVDQAANQWAALLKAHPQQPVLRAYAGASTAMRANTTLLPWKKMSLAEDGLAQIDKALAQLTPAHDAPAFRGVPASLETRFTAASTFLALPGFFNRQERGQRLLGEVLASPLLVASPLPFRASVWLTAAQQAQQDKRTDDARRLLQQVADSGAPQAAAARSRLAAL
jgi:hypothetical protein